MVTGGYLGWVSNLLREGVDGLGGSYFFSPPPPTAINPDACPLVRWPPVPVSAQSWRPYEKKRTVNSINKLLKLYFLQTILEIREHEVKGTGSRFSACTYIKMLFFCRDMLYHLCKQYDHDNVVKEPICKLPWQSLALHQLKYLQIAVN